MVGAPEARPDRVAINRHSLIVTCVDRFGSRGSWLHTIMSTWNRDARNRRSRSPDAPVQAVTGIIFARTPSSSARTFSASGVNIVLMLFASMTPAASESLAARRSRI